MKDCKRGARRLARAALRVVSCLALTASLVPAAAISALAYEGEFFEVDGLYYLYTGAAEGVQLVGADPEIVGAEDGICTVPATVEFEGKTLPVMSVKHNQTTLNPAPNASDGGAFVNCTHLVDLRFECLAATADTLYCSAGFSIFKGCDSLEVVHFLGNGGTADTSAAALSDLKVIIHQGCVEAQNGSMSNLGNYSASGVASVYYSLIFETNAGEQAEVFVSENAQVSQLSSLTAELVYTDSDKYGSEGLALVSAAPEIASTSSWVVTTAGGSTLGVGDTISYYGTAAEVSALDLNCAVMQLTTSEFDYDGEAGKDPGAWVQDANGLAVDPANYSLVYYFGDTFESATKLDSVADICEAGTYWVVATGIGAYTGSCSTSFVVNFVESSWTRANGGASTSTTNLRHLLSYQARAQQSAFANAAGNTISTSAVLVVNGDDYASCVVATSLASLFNCSVITVDEECIRASNGKLTATNVTNYASVLSGKLAIVLGDSSYISDAVYEAVQETVGSSGKSTRFDTESCTSAAQIAEVAYAMVRAVEDGEFNLGVSMEEYSDAAMVVPSSGTTAVFSALVYANTNNMAVFFAASDGRVSDQTLACLADFDEVVVAGFDAATAAVVEAALPAGVTSCSWAAQADSISTSIAYAECCLAAGTNTCSSVAVCPATDFGRLAAVAAQVGFGGSVMVLADDTDAAAEQLASFVGAHLFEINNGYVFATYLEIPLSTQIKLQALRMQQSAKQLEFATVEVETSTFAYTGSAVTPSVKVTALDGTVLTEGTDYLLYYYNSTTSRSCYTATQTNFQVDNSTRAVDSATTSTMVDEGSYTVIVKGTYQEMTRAGDASATEILAVYGTYAGQAAFSLTIGAGSEVSDYAAAYAEWLDEADYSEEGEEPEEAEGVEDSEEAEEPSADSGTSEPADGEDNSAAVGSKKDAVSLTSQGITCKSAAKTVKAKKLKKKALTCKFKVTGAHTTLVAKAANKKSKKALKVKVSGKTVKVTLARGTKKGTYKVKVYAAASSKYAKSATKTITIKVK